MSKGKQIQNTLGIEPITQHTEKGIRLKPCEL